MSQGERKNEGKLKWHTFPLFLIEPLIRVGDFGAKKYAAFNFLKGLSVNACLDSAKRHMAAFEDPSVSDFDEESGLVHLAHAAWNLLVAAYMVKTRPDLDNRYKGETRLENEYEGIHLTGVTASATQTQESQLAELRSREGYSSHREIIAALPGETVQHANGTWTVAGRRK